VDFQSKFVVADQTGVTLSLPLVAFQIHNLCSKPWILMEVGIQEIFIRCLISTVPSDVMPWGLRRAQGR